MYEDEMSALHFRTRSMGIPFSGMVELTPRCNLHCGFCYVCDRGKHLDVSGEKSAEEWLDLISQAVDLGLLKLAFTGGDPFMREDFEEIYCKAYDMGLRLSVLTNAILIGKKQRNWLKKRKPDVISVSLYGASEESYRTVSGGYGNFKRLKDSLDGLQEDGLSFELKALAMRPLIGEYEAMGCLVADYQCQGKFDPYMCSGRDDPERYLAEWRVPPIQILKLFRDFHKSLLTSAPPVKKSKEKPNSGHFYCGAGKNCFFVTWDGRMLGCPSLYCFASRPFEVGFASAWADLKTLICNTEPCLECQNCEERDICSACPVNRLVETGSVTSCSLFLHEMARCLSAKDQLESISV